MANQQKTLREIAKKANVSAAAVSYALHGNGRMSPQMRSHLEQMLKEEGYKPSYKLRPVLYITSHLFFRDMHMLHPLLSKYEGMTSCFHAEDMPYRLELLHMPGSPPLEEQLNALLAFRPSGVLLDTDLEVAIEDAAKFFTEAGVPQVQLGHVPRAQGIDGVVVDSFGGAYHGTQHLIAQGHKRIATIRWNSQQDPASRQKFAGFGCALNEAGLEVRDEYVVEAPLGKRQVAQPGRVAIEQLLRLPQPPTAVFVENSFVSPSLLYPLPAEETVPARIAEIDMVHFEAWCLDWVEQVLFGKLSFPPRDAKLLRIDWYEMGQVAAKRMLANLENSGTSDQVIRLAPRLVRVLNEEEMPLNI